MSFKSIREASGSVCALLGWSQADGWSEDLAFNNRLKFGKVVEWLFDLFVLQCVKYEATP